MDQGPYLIDTNVFVIDLRYPLVTWDRNHFLDRFAGRGATPEEILA